jgi:Bacterial extracellular solute-binding protein
MAKRARYHVDRKVKALFAAASPERTTHALRVGEAAMSLKLVGLVLTLTVVFLQAVSTQAAPPITGSPVLDAPDNVLAWPVERGVQHPSLSEPTANQLNDMHATFDHCDMSFTTAGNYHMALQELWNTVYLPSFGDTPLRNWFYTTSPPIVRRQIDSGVVQIGNVDVTCRPQVAAAPIGTINNLKAGGLIDGEPVAVIKNRGNVILVKKGNPKQIRSIYDLARPDIRVVTPNPMSEPGSFSNYAGAIYDIALHDPHPPVGMDAEKLFEAIFNSRQDDASQAKWLAGSTIHHREVPWSVAYGHGDAAVIFYHLALHALRTFPALFEIVPLGGTVEEPQPLPGNPQEVTYLVRLKGNFTARQVEATQKLFQAYQSSAFTAILARHGLTRP